MSLTASQDGPAAAEKGKKLLQYKRDLISAIKQEQYDAALQASKQALALAPNDPMLQDFHATVQAKVDQDASSSAAEEDNDSSGAELSETEEGSAAGEAADASASDDDDADDDAASSSEDGSEGVADEADAGSPAHSVSHRHGPAAEAPAGSLLQGLQDSMQGLGIASNPPAEVSGIKLETGCCTLSHQDRKQLRQRLGAAADDERTAAVQQQLMQDDPLLAGL